MMAANGQDFMDEEAALLDWTNAYLNGQTVGHFSDLSSGHLLWTILHEIDASSFTGTLPGTKQDYDANLQNIQYVYIQMQERLDASEKVYDRLSTNDLRKIAAGQTDSDTLQLLRMMLLIVVCSPNIEFHLGRIQELPGNTPQILGELLRNMLDMTPISTSEVPRSANSPPVAPYDRSTDDASPLPDPRREIFALEEQVARTVAQLERRNREFESLEGEHQIVGESLARLQATNDALGIQVADRDEQLKKLNTMNNQREQSSVKELEFKISHQEELIGSHEAENSQLRSAVLDLQRDNQRFIKTDEKLQKLQDEHDATKAELEKQSRKANTVEKYMQKVQNAQVMEKERERLRQDLEETRRQLSSSSSLRLENLALQTINSEVSRTLAQIEREFEEMRITNRQLRLQRDELSRRNEDLEERAVQDERLMTGFTEERADTDAPRSPPIEGVLEQELSQSSDKSVNTTNVSTGQDESQPDSVDRRDIHKAQMAVQITDAALATCKDEDRSDLQRLKQENDDLQSSLRTIELKCVKLENRLYVPQGKDDLLLENDNLENPLAPEESRVTSGVEKGRHGSPGAHTSEDLRNDLKVLLEDQLADDNKSRILEIVMGKLDEARDQTVSERKSQRYDHVKLQLRDLELEITNLKSKQSASSTLDDKQHIWNLERENKLMSTAFYDLASRLQLNMTSLQRRSDTQRSWLARQRHALEVPIGLAR